MIVYTVSYSVGGYAREDADVLFVGGIYTNKELDDIHAKVVHGTVTPIELDVMPKEIQRTAKELGLLKSTTAGLKIQRFPCAKS